MKTLPKMCIDAAIAAGADKATAKEIVQNLVDKKKELEALGKIDNLETDLAESWLKEMDEEKIAKALQRKQAALNVLRRKELNSYIDTVKSEGFSFLDAMEAQLVGSFKRITGARNSVAARRQGIQKQWTGGMLNELNAIASKYDVNIRRLFRRDKNFHDGVAAEMFEPGVTGDAMSRELADMFSRYMEQARMRLNEAGANIGKLENYVPQTHDPFKMGTKPEKGGDAGAAWVDYIKQRLDLEKTFPDLVGNDEAINDALSRIYATILTRGEGQVSAYERGDFVGPSNMANRYGRHRSLHFKDAKAFVEYNDTYGRGNILDGMQRRLENSSRDIALMEAFGPNPISMIDSLFAEEKQLLSDNAFKSPQETRKQLDTLDSALTFGNSRGGKITHWLAELTGESSWALNMGAARALSVARATQALSKLGAATLSSLADPFIKASAMRVAGLSWPEAVIKSISQYFDFYTGDKKKLARELGFLTDGIIGDLKIRWDVNEALPGTMADIQNSFFKWSGLNWITESGKAGYAIWFSNHLAKVSDIEFTKLDAPRRALLEYHGIGESQWEAMRHMVETASDGKAYFVPRLAANLTNEQLEKLLPEALQVAPTDPKQLEKWKRIREREFDKIRQELQTQAASMIADEALFAVLEPDEKTRATMFRGTRPGTVEGEVLRSIFQFKSFPMAYAQRVLGGRRWVQGDLQAGMNYGWLNLGTYKDALLRDVPGVVGFAASSLMFGYTAMVLKDLAKGKKPRDPFKQETMIAAFMQSGGLGIVGDFMFGKVDRFGNSFASAMVGPLGGVVGSLATIGGEAIRGDLESAGEDSLRLLASNTPFINLWYTKAAVDWLILYHMREWVSPGSLEREARRIKDEFNQEFIVPPHTKIQKGGGFK